MTIYAGKMQHVLLKDITLDSIQTTIRVRAVRFCEHLKNETPPQPLWIDLVLLDEEGKAMAGQIPQRWITLFKEQVKQDSVYYISYFQVCNARPTYRPVDHPYMMRFTAHTKVHELGLMCLTPGLIKLNIHQILLEF